MKIIALLLTAIMPFALISCGDKDTSTTKVTTEQPNLKHVLLKEKPAQAIDISTLRSKHFAGENVTFTGKIIGAKKVLNDGYAVMIMGDPKKLTTCDLKSCDTCDTPWDVCCDAHEDIKNNIVTVQILDQKGKPYKSGIKGLAGIKEMSALTVTGMVDKMSSKDNMIINASGIFVN